MGDKQRDDANGFEIRISCHNVVEDGAPVDYDAKVLVTVKYPSRVKAGNLTRDNLIHLMDINGDADRRYPLNCDLTWESINWDLVKILIQEDLSNGQEQTDSGQAVVYVELNRQIRVVPSKHQVVFNKIEDGVCHYVQEALQRDNSDINYRVIYEKPSH